jgi:hypothetical protein
VKKEFFANSDIELCTDILEGGGPDVINQVIDAVNAGKDVEIDLKGHVAVVVCIRKYPDGRIEIDIYDDDQQDGLSDPVRTVTLTGDGTAGNPYKVDGFELDGFIIEYPCEDCNHNGEPDDRDIASGGSPDENGNGVPDECECPGDITGPNGDPDGVVDTADFFFLLQNWGPCPPNPNPCPADIEPPGGDGQVNTADFFKLLQSWGPCD